MGQILTSMRKRNTKRRRGRRSKRTKDCRPSCALQNSFRGRKSVRKRRRKRKLKAIPGTELHDELPLCPRPSDPPSSTSPSPSPSTATANSLLAPPPSSPPIATANLLPTPPPSPTKSPAARPLVLARPWRPLFTYKRQSECSAALATTTEKEPPPPSPPPPLAPPASAISRMDRAMGWGPSRSRVGY